LLLDMVGIRCVVCLQSELVLIRSEYGRCARCCWCTRRRRGTEQSW